MRIGLPEAVDLFRKWFEDKSVVRCEGSFSMFAFSLDGRIVSVSEDEVRIISEDTGSELILRLSASEFGYADSRGVTGIEGEKYDSCVVLFYNEKRPEGPPDTIAIAAQR
jgi:hypothetical protein